MLVRWYNKVRDELFNKVGDGKRRVRVLGDGSRPYLFINWFLRPISVAEIPEALVTLTQEGLFHNPAYLFYLF